MRVTTLSGGIEGIAIARWVKDLIPQNVEKKKLTQDMEVKRYKIIIHLSYK